MRKEILFFAILACLPSVYAVKVGVVVEFPEGEIFTQCVQISEETNGYEVMESTALNLTWSFHDAWGHSLCAIEDTGCPSDNCWCSSEYWNFYIKSSENDSWSYSPVGFDGGSSCQEHYCAEDGNLLGFGYGTYGTQPVNYTFAHVCMPGDIDGDHKADLLDLSLLGQSWSSSSGDENYNGGADFNHDGIINLSDLAILGQNWGNIY